MPNFEFVSANYDFKNTIMNGLVKPYKIFNKEGIKVGVFGLGSWVGGGGGGVGTGLRESPTLVLV